MLVNDVFNKEELSALIITELKELGVKYRKEKKSKYAQEKCGRKRIFRVHLHQLELTDVLLSGGGVVQIPSFVNVACQRILEQVQTEGLFRKAGSTLRQKEIRASLENGLPLGKNYHVIDVANVLKSFFRELPEPLLPPNLHEALLRSLLITEGKLRAILMTCLLLPPLTINTLAFFMQFLNKVSLKSDENKMSIGNLAIIFTPGLMPLLDITSIRFNNHVKIIHLLIQNAEMLGVLPENIAMKLTWTVNTTPRKSNSDAAASNITEKKKKKRRSGSLTRMFNGFRKIVGALGSSSENLENTPENAVSNTPCISKSTKKRKMTEAVSGFSTKKKKELISLLPDGSLLPNTPANTKDTKKPKLSIVGGRKNLKYLPSLSSNNHSSSTTSIERRWSVVGSGWNRKKNSKKEILKPMSPVVSMPCIPDLVFPKMELLDQQNISTTSNPNPSISTISFSLSDENNKSEDSSDYVRIPKFEYEAIKERVESIEKRISQEFGNVHKSLLHDDDNSMMLSPPFISASEQTEYQLSGPERVLSKFEKTVEETETIAISPTTDLLAKRFSRELKIRRSAECRVFRSPSARKIGTIRRRSREKARLSRNATWHIGSTRGDITQPTTTPSSGIAFYPKNISNLKRGRPNTVQTGLHNPSLSFSNSNVNNSLKNSEIELFKISDESPKIVTRSRKSIEVPDQWIDGELFFKNDEPLHTPKDDSMIFATPTTKSIKQKSTTPNFVTTIDINAKTPMLPPKSIPKRLTKTPGSVTRTDTLKTPGIIMPNKMLLSPFAEDCSTGRASIARLRTQNAGMVMAKAKLFDDLDHQTHHLNLAVPSNTNLAENRRQSSLFIINKFAQRNLSSPTDDLRLKSTNMKHLKVKKNLNDIRENNRTPRRKNQNVKSPGYIQKRQRGTVTKYPDRQLLVNVVESDISILKGDKLKHNLIKQIENNTRNSPRNSVTPKIRKTLKLNSPRRLLKTPLSEKNESAIKCRTPIRATKPFRHSPRFQVSNRSHNA